MMKLLVISIDTVSSHASGAGLRYLKIAETLSESIDVTLAVPNPDIPHFPKIKIITYRIRKFSLLDQELQNADVILASGYLIKKIKKLQGTKARLIIDLYDPFLLENLFYNSHMRVPQRFITHMRSLEITNFLAQSGDFFICGTERQRDFWLGVLAANNRINPLNFELDPEYRKLIHVVSVGIPDRPITEGSFLKNYHPAFQKDVKIVLWGGGLWDWLDPLPLIQIWPQIIDKHPDARLVFLGAKHPNPSVPIHEIVSLLVNEAKQIDEYEKTIFFLDWISLDDRERLFSEACVGVTLQKQHIETRFSIRTRIIDYIWAELPIVINEGDVTAEWVKEYNLGKVIKNEDPESLYVSLIEILDKNKKLESSDYFTIKQKLSWDTICTPIVEFCLHGRSAPDLHVVKINRKINSFSFFIRYLMTAVRLREVSFLINRFLGNFRR